MKESFAVYYASFNLIKTVSNVMVVCMCSCMIFVYMFFCVCFFVRGEIDRYQSKKSMCSQSYNVRVSPACH